MIKKNNILLYILALFCMVFFFYGCSNQSEKETQSEKCSYSVTVRTEGEMVLPEVKVLIYEDNSLDELVTINNTDGEGRISFEATQSDDYVAVLQEIPEGYHVEEYYEIESEITQIILKTELLPITDLADTDYTTGNVAKDFSVTTSDGTECTISELLKEKKAVVLNFWYLTCDPCRMEFPYLQEAYEQYKDEIAVIAMNPVNTRNDEIEDFRKEFGITFYMAKCSQDWEMAVQLTGYPTTVVIDRYGYISFIHRGSVTDTETFTAIFEYYTSDEYKQTTVDDIADM